MCSSECVHGIWSLLQDTQAAGFQQIAGLDRYAREKRTSDDAKHAQKEFNACLPHHGTSFVVRDMFEQLTPVRLGKFR
jgi:hypothetical protein